MDIKLATGSNETAIELKNCQRLGNRDYRCFLSVRSGAFSAGIVFYFEHHGLMSFVSALESVYQALVGEAQLKAEFEEPYISFEGDGRGHVWVRGRLLTTGPNFQTFQFEFDTDQTCLPPFISALRDLQHLEIG